MMLNFSKKYLSLRYRFLLATAAVILALTFSYGLVAIVGYLVSFDKTSYYILRSQSNLFHSLAKWENSELSIIVPKSYTINCRSLALIYDNKGNLLWRENRGSEIENAINPNWLKKNGFHTIELKNNDNVNNKDNCLYKTKNDKYDKNNKNTLLTYSVAVNIYPATNKLPEMVIVIIDTVPQDRQESAKVWKWFGYVLIANLLLVIPFILFAANWSLKPINLLTKQINELENGEREKLDENPPAELSALVINLNKLLSNERKRHAKYQTTLADLTHSLKTPLAVLQSTLRSLHPPQNLPLEQTEPMMLEQIQQISQQIKYSLHRANIRSDDSFLLKQRVPVSTLLNKLITALTKVYQHKGVVITFESPSEVTWLGKEHEFYEVMGNILENACKYCRTRVNVTLMTGENALIIVVDDDGLGVPPDKREMIFQRGLRVDTLQPGQGLGLSIASEIVEQYQGSINIEDSPLGGARVQVIFRLQNNNHLKD
ncbi:Virulence sensor histidine kinase phoQ [Xenorhabdus poinarii G6]|uniref:histidine kinase n=1 Tax=Xenorhabdus poinarii G6 TaxID=1354304 RepID=A0A068R4E9_9GAMM|nr:two-component system sensor histidine kinase PhoQ [Xenorhabdus poinarii]CDG21005.1 Virulence sensor histidine kinase phoQ [Xenorhabdus poinarii G6]